VKHPEVRFRGYGAQVQEALRALRSVALFAGAPSGDLERVAAVAFPRRLARGQVLFVEGEHSDHLYVVDRGRVKVLVSSTRGDELVLSVLGPGDALGELSALDGVDRSATAVALDDVWLWCVPADAVRGLLQRSPAVALAVAEELASRVRRLTGSAADLVFLDLPRRLAKLLVSDESAAAGLTQSELGAQLGVTRQSLNRSLQRLQDRGWILVHRGGIDVLDRQALDRFAHS
jgi:CRP/FNR family cyclic AMP-dependent transcriptional regulator